MQLIVNFLKKKKKIPTLGYHVQSNKEILWLVEFLLSSMYLMKIFK